MLYLTCVRNKFQSCHRQRITFVLSTFGINAFTGTRDMYIGLRHVSQALQLWLCCNSSSKMPQMQQVNNSDICLVQLHCSLVCLVKDQWATVRDQQTYIPVDTWHLNIASMDVVTRWFHMMIWHDFSKWRAHILYDTDANSVLTMLQAAIEKLSRGYMLADLVSIIGNVFTVSII